MVMDMDMDMDVDMDMDMDIDVYHRPNLERACNVGCRLLSIIFQNTDCSRQKSIILFIHINFHMAVKVLNFLPRFRNTFISICTLITSMTFNSITFFI